MPGTDGYALIRELRKRTVAGVELRAIAVTAQARVEDKQRGLAAGYDEFLVKPIQPRDALAAVQRQLDPAKHAPALP